MFFFPKYINFRMCDIVKLIQYDEEVVKKVKLAFLKKKIKDAISILPHGSSF